MSTLPGLNIVNDPDLPPDVFYVVGAGGEVVAWAGGTLTKHPSKDAMYDALFPGRRLAREEAERIGQLVRGGISAAFRWYGGPWPYAEPGEVPVSRPDREAPHRFPGVEAAHAGREFFSSDCAYGCGAYITASGSAPARDRWADGRGYGGWPGVGTCPNAPRHDHAFSVRDGRPWCLLCGGSDPAAPCLRVRPRRRRVTALPGPARGTALIEGPYRYYLTRRWGPGLPVTWICLNPSVADAERDDATLRKIMGFTRSWGYNAVAVVNLFAMRETQAGRVAALWYRAVVDGREADVVGPDNDRWVGHFARSGALVVAAWGQAGFAGRRAREVAELLGGVPLHSLGTTKDGAPRHPCRLAYATTLSAWASPSV